MLNLNVKKLTLLLILALAAVSGWRLGYAKVGPQILAAAAVTVAIETAVNLVRRKKIVWSDSAAITGLIIGGVAAPGTSWSGLLIMAVLAMGSKYLIATERRNIFNPAAFGLLLGTVAFGVQLSWWVDSVHWLTLVLGSLLFVKLTGHWRMVLTFLAAFAVLIAARSWLGGLSLAMELYLYISITSFFIFFMATDPRTSPIKASQQPQFALIVAIGSFLSVLYHPSSIFLGGLLAANLAAAWMNHLALYHPKPPPARPQPVQPPPPPPPQPPAVKAGTAVPPIAPAA